MNKTMRNLDAVNQVNRLNDFVRKDIVVPIRVSYAISKNINALLQILEPYETERKKIADAREKAKQEELIDLDKRFQELVEIECDVDVCMVTKDLLNDLPISTKDYMTLEFMIQNE